MEFEKCPRIPDRLIGYQLSKIALLYGSYTAICQHEQSQYVDRVFQSNP
jgi:hypothetical protein